MRVPDFQLAADEIIDAAIEILQNEGLDAVSMRSVSAKLGVSPVPLYSRVGNKDDLLDRVAEKLLADLAPAAGANEPWYEYADRWALELRRRLKRAPDNRIILRTRRWAYVTATEPLVQAMRAGGMTADEAVRGCRLVLWTTMGFVVMETATSTPLGDRARVPGGDPSGVSEDEADALFEAQLGYLFDGLRRETA